MTIKEITGGEQLSDRAIKERLRPAALRAVERLIELMESTNENVALGAARDVISRFVPAIRATELKDGDGQPLFQALVKFLDANHNNRNTPGV